MTADTPMPTELHELTAEQAVAALRRDEVSPLEMVQASLRRMEAVDPLLNALPTRCIERAMAAARSFKRGAQVPGESGWLA